MMEVEVTTGAIICANF